MTENTTETYRIENDKEMINYWMKRGPKTAAFLLVIPGAALSGYGAGLLLNNPLAWTVIGAGAGMVMWGFIVALSK